MRINARLDETTQQQLDYIRNATKESVTEIVKNALHLYYQQLRRQSGDRTRQLLESDFIGCADGPEDLATHYKRYLGQGWGEKHGDR